MKKVLWILIGIVTSSMIFQSQVLAADNGSCGANCTWTLVNKKDGTKELQITGSGPMNYYATWQGHNICPWYDVKDTITSAVVSDGITTIGGGAFWNLTNLSSVKLPDTITRIDDHAFSDTPNLHELDLPSSINYMSSYAAQRTGLNSVVVPASLSSLSSDHFYGSNIQNIYCTSAQIAVGGFCSNATKYEIQDGKFMTYDGDQITGIYDSSEKLIHGETVTSYDIKDTNGRVIKTLNGNGSIITTYKYDGGGNIIEQYDGKGNLIYSRTYYTVEEATRAVSGKGKNTFKLKYR